MRACALAGLMLASFVAGCAAPQGPAGGAASRPAVTSPAPAAAGASARSEALEEAYRRGSELYEAGRYADAEPFWKEALVRSERERGPDHPDTAVVLGSLAELYWYQGRYAEAEPLHRRALAIREKAFGPEHPEAATTLNNLAAAPSS
jgi:tetratricopeptide (TPR) repeat protein